MYELPQVYSKLLQEFPDALFREFVGLPNLFVVEIAIGPPERVDPRAVAESEEEALSLADRELRVGRDRSDSVAIDADFVCRAIKQDRTNVVGIRNFRQMAHFSR